MIRFTLLMFMMFGMASSVLAMEMQTMLPQQHRSTSQRLACQSGPSFWANLWPRLTCCMSRENESSEEEHEQALRARVKVLLQKEPQFRTAGPDAAEDAVRWQSQRRKSEPAAETKSEPAAEDELVRWHSAFSDSELLRHNAAVSENDLVRWHSAISKFFEDNETPQWRQKLNRARLKLRACIALGCFPTGRLRRLRDALNAMKTYAMEPVQEPVVAEQQVLQKIQDVFNIINETVDEIEAEQENDNADPNVRRERARLELMGVKQLLMNAYDDSMQNKWYGKLAGVVGMCSKAWVLKEGYRVQQKLAAALTKRAE